MIKKQDLLSIIESGNRLGQEWKSIEHGITSFHSRISNPQVFTFFYFIYLFILFIYFFIYLFKLTKQ
jgi:hypothetical protein